MRRGIGGQGRALGDEADDDAPMREDERTPAAGLFHRGNQIEIGTAPVAAGSFTILTCHIDVSARSE